MSESLFESLALFGDLPDHDRQWLQGKLRRRSLRDGETVFCKGDTETTIYLIITGRVKICVTTPDGRESVIAILSPGDCFGELAALDGEPRSADAVAMEDSAVWCLAGEDFSELLDRSPQFSRRLIAVLTRRLRDTDKQTTDLVFFDVFGRVARKLLQLADSHGVNTPRGIEIPFRLTQQDLANLIGSTRESVNKALRFYRERGYISLRGIRVTIVSRSGLERRSQP